MVGPDQDNEVFQQLRKNAGDRGRDGGRFESTPLSNGQWATIGNWRAIPTTEYAKGKFQPYNGLVHNGTISNDAELGKHHADEIDSEVLSRVVWRDDVGALAKSLGKVKGSYAMGCVTPYTLFLACNYKPIHYAVLDGTFYFSSMERHFDGILPWGQRPVKMEPYTAMDVVTRETVKLPRQDGKRAAVIASAGLDSTVVATQLVREGYDVTLVHFRYGCRAETAESSRIGKIADALGCRYVFLPIDYTASKGSSPLLQAGAEIAGGIEGAEYAHEWVPARNLVMLALTTAYAEANGIHVIALGNNLEEAGAYPDNEEQFTTEFDSLLNMATQEGYRVRVVSPVGNLMKHEIVKLGTEVGAPFEHTWSCYKGGDRHCGECGPCFMRKEAFERCGLKDPVFG
jgi:7-cyano-7-deazaguanine synthase